MVDFPGAKKKEETGMSVYEEADALDVQAFVDSQTGRSVAKHVYHIPAFDAVGVSAAGVFRCIQYLGGCDVDTVGMPEKTTKDGKPAYRVKGRVYDKFTGTSFTSTITLPVHKVQNADFADRTAETFAQRNACRKLLDPSCLDALAQIAREGREFFTEEDVEKAFAPIWKERKKIKEEYIRLRLQAGHSAPLQLEVPPPPAEASPEDIKDVETSAPTKKLPKDDPPPEEKKDYPLSDYKFPGSPKQRGVINGNLELLKFTEEEQELYLRAKIRNKDDLRAIMDIVMNFNNPDRHEDMKGWLKGHRGEK